MVLNQQRRIAVDVAGARKFAQNVRAVLKLGRREFNICLVDDARIAELNGRYRRKAKPTDVLSFPWLGAAAPVYDRGEDNTGAHHRTPPQKREFEGFLGDVVISAESARRNARAAGHSTAREIRWLILHGVLHLLGYDHVTDRGEMNAVELALRDRLDT